MFVPGPVVLVIARWAYSILYGLPLTPCAQIGGNYAPGIYPQLEVAKQGYQQNLWLFGKEDYITEGMFSYNVYTPRLTLDSGNNESLFVLDQ
jgi:branched-subunit amino acid aminotransferase/4-amino-4-deoxychorismate lyase